ncbi:FAD-dependent monooxygenase [Bosea sp. LjRoot237]|uniref:FAD-dependent monooxygenase n=1 Tax=Bosea sp. LjRoot237 TaxID=3342292 RepID=UPI003ECC8CE9
MLTKTRDLRTGRSVWQGKRPPRFPRQGITADIESDVVVIGAGISGAMQADALSEAGFQVLVIDRRGPVTGFSGNGITYSRIGAEIVRSGLLGKGDPDAELYAFRS